MMRLDEVAVAGPYELRRARGSGSGQPVIANEGYGDERHRPAPPMWQLATQADRTRDKDGRLMNLKVDGAWKNFCFKFN